MRKSPIACASDAAVAYSCRVSPFWSVKSTVRNAWRSTERWHGSQHPTTGTEQRLVGVELMLHQHAVTRQRTRSGNATAVTAADDKHRAAVATGAIGATVAGRTARRVVGWAPARASARAPSRAANDAMAANRRLEVRRRFVTRKVGQTQPEAVGSAAARL